MPLLSGTNLRVATWSITAITKANPCVMTIPGHTMVVGDLFFVENVAGMTNVNQKWFGVGSVSGNNVSLTATGASVGRVVPLGTPVDSSAYGTYTSGGTAKPQTTRGTYTWPANATLARVRLHGSGGAGGGSAWAQLAGAGGSGACAFALVPRPTSGTSAYVIDRGMPGVQQGALSSWYLYSGPTAFGTYSYTPAGTPAFDGVNPATDTPVTGPAMSGDCWAHGAGIGQRAGGTSNGGDGGTPGVAGGTYVYCLVNGGQGGASIATVKDFSGTQVNSSYPAGATGAGGGGMGGNNGQDGAEPGGGGAPGSLGGGVDTGFACTASACPSVGRETGQSGCGGPGLIVIETLLFGTLRPLPPVTQQAIDPTTGLLTQPWFDYFTRLDAFARGLRS